MAYKKRHKFDIDASGLRCLHDLYKFDVHQFRLAQGKYRKCNAAYDAQFKKFMTRIMYRLKKKHEHKAMKLAHQMFILPEYKFSIDFYYNFLDMTKLPLKFHQQIATYLQTVANKMMQLHLKECQILKQNEQDKRILYYVAGQSLFMKDLDNLSVSREFKEYYYTVSCQLCMRGCLLFNTLVDVYHILNTLRLSRGNYRNNSVLIEQHFWKYLNLFKMNYTQFEYCPYHMKIDISSLKSESNKDMYECNYCHNHKMWNINSMIINHSAYSVKMNQDTHEYRLFVSIWYSIVNLAGITAYKREYNKLFQIGTIILDISTKLLKLTSKSTDTKMWQAFVAKLNLSAICGRHYKSKSTVTGYGLGIVLLAFFQVAVDKDEIQLCRQFDNQQGKLIKCLEMRDTDDDREHEWKHETMDTVLGFWLNRVSPLKYNSSGIYFDFLCQKFIKLQTKCKLNENIELEDITYNPSKDFDNFDCAWPKIKRCEYPLIQLKYVHTAENPTESQVWTRRAWAYIITYLDSNGIHGQYKAGQKIFENDFKLINRQMEQFNNNKKLNMNDWQKKVNLDTGSFNPFMWYAMFLFEIKSKKACKYFEFCLKSRPLNAYLHFQYAIYLCRIIHDYKLSYFHLRLSKQLNLKMFDIANVDVDYDHDEKDDDDNYKVKQEYKKLLKLLFIKLNKQRRCNYKYCNKLIKDGNVLKLRNVYSCSGCHCVLYCNKKCQKRDWIDGHKHNCISKCMKKFDCNKWQILKQTQLLLTELIKQYEIRKSIGRANANAKASKESK